ncbi:MAG: preprotein translocase subunit SecA [Patescibacteria group bacterium]|jgi:preprotein translocase subunit SecA
MSLFKKIFGDPNKKEVQKLLPIVEKINSLESEFKKLSDKDLIEKTNELKNELKNGKSKDQILPEAFALTREASKRTLQQRHFDVQLMAGIILHKGQIAELKTGEGKTLAATLAAYLNALDGKGVHIITVNDYLARRDTVWMGQIYYALGLSVSCIVHDAAFIYDPNYQPPVEENSEQNENEKNKEVEAFKIIKSYLRPVKRKEAYQADITYGTNNEFGFDYLRDNLVYSLDDMAQREFNYAIVDEVDSILIDEARTPLIISSPAEESADLYFKLARLAKNFKKEEDYIVDEKMQTVILTEGGQNKLVAWLGEDPWATSNFTMVHHIESALKAESLFTLDRNYVVKDGEIVIVDEFTGRLMFGRRYSEGLHQAIEAKENVEVKQESNTLATVSFQNYFRLYKKLAGMTGTALSEAEEFDKIYHLEVVAIPTNKPVTREDLSDKIYRTEEGKYNALAEEIKKCYEKGQPVLVGTISVDKNELVSQLLERKGIPHEVLNAKNHEREGQIIAQAGRMKAITVATNMAGRGVDIILGGNPPNPEEQKKVIEAGGLRVIGTERHESRRIDNQLRGRSGRQGDPGSTEFFISLEDDLMRIFGGNRISGLMQTLKIPEDFPIENRMVSRAIESAQRKVEEFNFDMRKHLLDYDDVLNKHRETIYGRRKKILAMDKEGLKEKILNVVEEEIKKIVAFHTAGDAEGQWDIKGIANLIKNIFPVQENLEEALNDIYNQAGNRSQDVYTRDRLIKYLEELAHEAYNKLEATVEASGKALSIPEPNLLEKIEKSILLQSIDRYWIYHLEIINNLKDGIGLRAYGQHDPLVEYKKESFQKFNQLLDAIDKQVVYSIYKVGLVERAPMQQSKKMSLSGAEKSTNNVEPINSKQKVGRNDPCPCGSGKKYKKCCGK